MRVILAVFLSLVSLGPLVAQDKLSGRIAAIEVQVFNPLIPDLRIRDAPGTGGKPIRFLGRDETLVALPEKPVYARVGSVDGSWIKVATSRGDSGWCFDGFLRNSWIGNRSLSGDFLGDGREVRIAAELSFKAWPIPVSIPASDYEKKILPRAKDPAIASLLGKIYKSSGGTYKLPSVDSEDYLYLGDYDTRPLGRFLSEIGYVGKVDGPADLYSAGIDFDQTLTMGVAGRVASVKKYSNKKAEDWIVIGLETVPKPGFTAPGAFAVVRLSDPTSDVDVAKSLDRLYRIGPEGLVDTGLAAERVKAEGESDYQYFIFPNEEGGEKERLILTDRSRDGSNGFGTAKTRKFQWNGKAFVETDK